MKSDTEMYTKIPDCTKNMQKVYILISFLDFLVNSPNIMVQIALNPIPDEGFELIKAMAGML